jgi:sec-independent protein translocase protein TatA
MLESIFLGFVGPWQIVLIVALVLLLFGGKKIPELMRGLGRGVKEFKEGTKEAEESLKDMDSEKQIKE